MSKRPRRGSPSSTQRRAPSKGVGGGRKARAADRIKITIKEPGCPVRVLRCVVKGQRTEFACVSGKEFKRVVTTLCCDERTGTVCREIPGMWQATGRNCKSGPKGTAMIVVTKGADTICTARTRSEIEDWCAGRKDRPARLKQM